MADDTGEIGEPDYLVMLSEVHRNIQQIYIFAESSEVANDAADFGEHDWLFMLSSGNRVICKPLANTVRSYLQYYVLAPLATSQPRSR